MATKKVKMRNARNVGYGKLGVYLVRNTYDKKTALKSGYINSTLIKEINQLEDDPILNSLNITSKANTPSQTTIPFSFNVLMDILSHIDDTTFKLNRNVVIYNGLVCIPEKFRVLRCTLKDYFDAIKVKRENIAINKVADYTASCLYAAILTKLGLRAKHTDVAYVLTQDIMCQATVLFRKLIYGAMSEFAHNSHCFDNPRNIPEIYDHVTIKELLKTKLNASVVKDFNSEIEGAVDNWIAGVENMYSNIMQTCESTILDELQCDCLGALLGLMQAEAFSTLISTPRLSKTTDDYDYTHPLYETSEINAGDSTVEWGYTSLVLEEDPKINIIDSIYELTESSNYRRCIKSSDSDFIVKFKSDEYKKYISPFKSRLDGKFAHYGKWPFTGIIKLLVPYVLQVNNDDALLVNLLASVELITPGNEDHLNDFMFDEKSKLLQGFSENQYNTLYSQVRNGDRLLVIKYEEILLILNIDRSTYISNVTCCYSMMAKYYNITHLLMHRVSDLINYMLEASKSGDIDVKFTESEIEVLGKKNNTFKVTHRKGSVVRAHFRHYKSGVVTLVRPHVRRGVNYIGKYVLEV